MSSSYYFLTNQLSEDETRVLTSIVNHIEKGGDKVGIAQIAKENFVSTSFIIKMCKRLGFKGYSELYYSLSHKGSESVGDVFRGQLKSLIDNFSEADVERFYSYLAKYHGRKLFAVGAGFADLVADYIVQRLGVSGFMVFNRVHFYDFMLFHEDNKHRVQSNIEPAMIIAISQSGESETVLNNVSHAKRHGFQVVTFTKREDSTLAGMSDITFIVDGAQQTLISGVPNPFFGKVILAFEELLGGYFLTLSDKGRGHS